MKFYIEETLPNGKRDGWIAYADTLEEVQQSADRNAYCYDTRIEIGTDYDHTGLFGKQTLCHRGRNGKWFNH